MTKNRARIFYFITMTALILNLQGCKKSGDDTGAVDVTANQPKTNPLVEQGKTIYMSRCIACHNTNPNLAGSLGPDLANSSLELIRLRVLEGKYPEGYKPKRSSAIMQVMPDLKENDIQALHAFIINSP